MIKKASLILAFFLTTAFPSNKVDVFIKNLHNIERENLLSFCQKLLNSFAGFVLFGDKPLCIESIASFNDPSILYPCEPSKIVQAWGFESLGKLNDQNANKKFPIIRCIMEDYNHLIFINRESFIQTVDGNISLFRSILGSTLTSEILLNELLQNNDRFYSILKNNKLILGILLGYGVQNALVGSRQEDLWGELCDQRNIFPYKDYCTFVQIQKTASIGFSSIEEENKALLASLQISTQLRPFTEYSIPHFACIPDSNETLDLLSRYEKNRKSIIEVAKSDDCLKKVLERLLTDMSGNISEIPKMQSLYFSPDRNDNLEKFSVCIERDLMTNSGVTKEDAIRLFLHGIEHQEKGDVIEQNRDFCPDVFANYLGFKKSNQIMKKIAQIPEIVEQIPQYLYYKVLARGKGKPAKNIQSGTFHFSFYCLDGRLVECGTINNCNLKDLIPGIAHALTGMRRKEERKIYIHPKYCYGLLPYALPIQINIQLIDFEEGNAEILPDPIEIHLGHFAPIDVKQIRLNPNYFNETPILKNPEDFLPFINQYKNYIKNGYIHTGYEFWKTIKEIGIQLDAKKLADLLLVKQKEKVFQNDEERRQFILGFKLSCSFL